MKKEIITLPEFKLVGISIRTNNEDLFKEDPSNNIIVRTIQKFFNDRVPEKITNRLNPGTFYCTYTDYESDMNGYYTFFIGEKVSSFDQLGQELKTLTVPFQKYAKFTNNSGIMPAACVNMWQDIWKMNASDLGGERAYITDFEVYDERSHDPKNTVLDICIGIRSFES